MTALKIELEKCHLDPLFSLERANADKSNEYRLLMNELKDKQFIRDEILNTKNATEEQCKDLVAKNNDMSEQIEHMVQDLQESRLKYKMNQQ